MAQYGMQPRKAQQPDLGGAPGGPPGAAGGRKPAMTVIGPVKKNKMGFYKPDAGGVGDERGGPASEDNGLFFFRQDKDTHMRMGGPHVQQPQQQHHYPGMHMNNGRAQMQAAQVSGPRGVGQSGVPPHLAGVPASPTRQPMMGGGMDMGARSPHGPPDGMRMRTFPGGPTGGMGALAGQNGGKTSQAMAFSGAGGAAPSGQSRFGGGAGGPGGYNDYLVSPAKLAAQQQQQQPSHQHQQPGPQHQHHQDDTPLDMSAFPALGASGQPIGSGQGAPGQQHLQGGPMGRGGMPPMSVGGYAGVGMGMKKAGDHNEGFNMVQQDFPALPGSKPNKPSDGPSSPGSSGPHSPQQQMQAMQGGQLTTQPQPQQQSMGIRSGERSGQLLSAFPMPPGSAESDRYKLIGLLGVIRMVDQDLAMLALGSDLTSQGLNLNSPEPLYPTFASPWAEGPLRSKEPQFQLPQCYSVKTPTLPPAHQRLNQVADETLLYIFYSSPSDVLQQVAACILFSRDWRYHKEQKLWVTRAPGMEPVQKTTLFERGTYVVFDVATWKKVPKELMLQYDLLEERRPMPTAAPPATTT
eukprot:m.483630 g.483630  ORF g.483630 m.483630 type:complete len:577 (+) comp23014_c0_seq1:185-1915(+)